MWLNCCSIIGAKSFVYQGLLILLVDEQAVFLCSSPCFLKSNSIFFEKS